MRVSRSNRMFSGWNSCRVTSSVSSIASGIASISPKKLSVQKYRPASGISSIFEIPDCQLPFLFRIPLVVSQTRFQDLVDFLSKCCYPKNAGKRTLFVSYASFCASRISMSCRGRIPLWYLGFGSSRIKKCATSLHQWLLIMSRSRSWSRSVRRDVKQWRKCFIRGDIFLTTRPQVFFARVFWLVNPTRL